MLKGWFDAFRVDGGPTLYSYSNRTPVVGDIRNILIYVTFCTLFVAFLLILPGLRKERLSTVVTVTTSLFIGATTLLANYGTDWHVAQGSISSSYRAYSKEILYADIKVRIGLNSVNVSLKADPAHSNSKGIDYNERFHWSEATELKKEFREALVRGLPYPVLTIAEYLSHDIEGFSWGVKYRKAGYYATITLWSCFAMWVLMNILLCMVPRYGAYTMVVTGMLALFSNILYSSLLPKTPLIIHFETQALTFSYGWCYWVIMAGGVLAVVVGASVSVVDNCYPNKFSTIFQVDYDTPYRYFVGQETSDRVPTTSSPAPSTQGLINSAFEGDTPVEYGTMINGKRAVSLKNFGKFAHKEYRPKMNLQRKINSFAGSRTPSRGREVNIDLRALW